MQAGATTPNTITTYLQIDGSKVDLTERAYTTTATTHRTGMAFTYVTTQSAASHTFKISTTHGSSGTARISDGILIVLELNVA